MIQRFPGRLAHFDAAHRHRHGDAGVAVALGLHRAVGEKGRGVIGPRRHGHGVPPAGHIALAVLVVSRGDDRTVRL